MRGRACADSDACADIECPGNGGRASRHVIRHRTSAVRRSALHMRRTRNAYPSTGCGSICGHGDPGGPGPGAAGRNGRVRRRSVHQSTCLDESCVASIWVRFGFELGVASQRLKKVENLFRTHSHAPQRPGEVLVTCHQCCRASRRPSVGPRRAQDGSSGGGFDAEARPGRHSS